MTAEESNQAETYRLRLWRERSSHSRLTGLILVTSSVILFVVAYFFPILVVEVASITSFTIGVYLLAYEAEPRVRLYPASMSLLGPIQNMVAQMKRANLEGRAVYVPNLNGVSMTFGSEWFTPADGGLPPPGHGLFESYEAELGPMYREGMEKALLWLPRLMVDGLNLAKSVRMKTSNDETTTVAERPFVRTLCLNEFMRANVCGTMGCPLMASVAEALARSTDRPVKHLGCSYDPTTQIATAKHQVLEQ